jgi:hypothetical protein
MLSLLDIAVGALAFAGIGIATYAILSPVAKGARLVVALIVAVSGVVVLGWIRLSSLPAAVVYAEASVRYQLEIIISGGGETTSASGVIESKFSLGSSVNGGTIVTKLRGQAIPIALPNGARIYALHRYPYAPWQSISLIDDACAVSKVLPEPRSSALWLDAVKQTTDPCTLPQHALPLLVRFGDSTDPDTIERVYPEQLFDMLGTTAGFRAVVKSTDTPISTGIESELPFLLNLPTHGFEISVRERESGKMTLWGEDFSTEVPR